MDNFDYGSEESVLAGPVPSRYKPGTPPFDALVKSVATSATRVGEAGNYGLFYWRTLPVELKEAAARIRDAHKLLLEAHSLLRSAAAGQGALK